MKGQGENYERDERCAAAGNGGMIFIVGMMIASSIATGCHSMGPSVRCELAPPVNIQPPAPEKVDTKPTDLKPVPVSLSMVPARSSRRVKHQTRPATSTSDDVTMRRRLESLVSIGDCTGAKTYATLSGRKDVADEAFRTCLGKGLAPAAVVASAP